MESHPQNPEFRNNPENLLGSFFMFIESGCITTNTGQPRYLKVQGNGGNTSRYPKFDIAKM